MAADIYVKEAQSSPLNAVEAGEVIEEGAFISLNSGGNVVNADPGNGAPVDGIVPNRERGPQIREHEEDYSPEQYEAGDGPVPFHQLEDGMELTQQALTAAAAIDMFEPVALDASLQAVPASSADAVSETLGRALQGVAAGEGVHVRVGL
ncbi:hypothetical protein PN419_00355 [Halorubrum ezzemoulense]|uniref:hypothetical protein n=1 Tax=Halorubrum ezzemoulense TaxID=337243 RepID=UPI00232A7DAF|nr:hypothetical protein [Halorubrum ezzemoulense]MDB9247458.1 hypothetical protein [Halorubrum ezzemoulense]MDB9258633.1 hypothetical protein [Halorubrum ezzemoulense]MDB9264509.1 hypothetical protein [Halorubrum ezzemoulense]MDB9268994.1 hypothetical protein [Halorubrum ezzemoulense]MDB9271477.1 hypothetical protein [Halorubrum ezzemoulense]